MRPRPDAAENPIAGPGGVSGTAAVRFNEAAARCRGKPAPDDVARRPGRTSRLQ